VLNCWKDSGNEYHYDIHFWLGQNTTLDEAGTAAYKTVELDTFLDDVPVQHREVEGFESPEFLNLFPQGIYILDGGIESGFFHVVPENYQRRLLKVKGVFRHCHCRQVPLSLESLNDGDVFILDEGHRIFQFQGANSGPFEKLKGNEVVNRIKSSRGHHVREVIVLDNDSPTTDDERFWEAMGGRGHIVPNDEFDQLERRRTDVKLFRLSDATGSLTCTHVADGRHIDMGMFVADDVFLLDKGYIIYVWIGRGASRNEKRKAMSYATKYIHDNHGGLPLPITVFNQDPTGQTLRRILE